MAAEVPETCDDPVVHMVAGSFAGIAEHFAIFPIDTVKTHTQTARSSSSAASASAAGGVDTARQLFAQRGFGGF